MLCMVSGWTKNKLQAEMQPIHEKPRLCVSILTEGERCKTRLEKDDEEPLCKSRLCMRTI